jgi:hypothetical protein
MMTPGGVSSTKAEVMFNWFWAQNLLRYYSLHTYITYLYTQGDFFFGSFRGGISLDWPRLEVT